MYNVARTPYTACCKAIARPVSRPLPSALHISSPPLSSFPALRHTPQQRTATICESTASNLQGYEKSSPGGGRRQLSDVVDDFINLPWQKIASWASVALLATQLRDFMGIAMGVFIVSFIGNGFVNSMRQLPQLSHIDPQKRRRYLVLTYYTFIILIFSLFGVLIIPDVVREGADFVSRLQTENLWAVVLQKMRTGLGDNMMDQLERFLVIASTGEVTQALDFVALDALSTEARTAYLGSALQKVLRQYTNAAASFTTEILSFVSKFAIQLGVSLILSFMMMWDLPAISRGVESLKTSRVAPIYNTVAPSLEIFATLFGKALQAQSRIAMVNTILTALGMWVLKIPGMGLLSLFVFICGFIPIAGVIISTVPIGFVALTEYGFMKLALVILMITGVHFVEAYGLNPAIYSAHLKLHPFNGFGGVGGGGTFPWSMGALVGCSPMCFHSRLHDLLPFVFRY